MTLNMKALGKWVESVSLQRCSLLHFSFDALQIYVNC